MKFAKPIFQSLFEDTAITTNFLKNHICNTCVIENRALLAVFNEKELRNSRSGHSILKGMEGRTTCFEKVHVLNNY